MFLVRIGVGIGTRNFFNDKVYAAGNSGVGWYPGGGGIFMGEPPEEFGYSPLASDGDLGVYPVKDQQACVGMLLDLQTRRLMFFFNR